MIKSFNKKESKKVEKIDYPLNGAQHPAVKGHHLEMAQLKKYEIKFNVKEFIQLLDDPMNDYYVSFVVKNSITDESNSYIPVPPEGINIYNLKAKSSIN